MTKDAPAFDFYPERWLVGTAHMSDAEQISYLRLLCHQWLTQGLPHDAKALRRLAGRGVSELVLEKFPVSEDGKRRNLRLEEVRNEQRDRIKKSREKIAKMNDARLAKMGLQGSLQDAPVDSHKKPLEPVLASSSPLTTHHSPQGTERYSQRARPTLEQAKSNAGQFGVTEDEADEWWHAREASDWMKGTGGGGTTPVGQNWQADMKSFTTSMREQRSRDRRKPTPPPFRPQYQQAQPDDEPEMNFAAIVEERQRKEREEIEEWHRQAGGANAA